MAKAAAERGLQMLGITDHGPAMPGGPHRYYFGNLLVLPQELYGVEILRGVEANILDVQGRLDLPEYYLRNLDFVLAGMHFVCYSGGNRRENTAAVLAVMDNPHVDGIVHPGNPEYEMDHEAIVKKAAAKNILIEVNNNSLRGKTRRGSETNCCEIVALVKKWGGTILVSSDAHFCQDVGSFEKSLELLAREGLGEEYVLNTSREKVVSFLAAKREK